MKRSLHPKDTALRVDNIFAEQEKRGPPNEGIITVFFGVAIEAGVGAPGPASAESALIRVICGQNIVAHVLRIAPLHLTNGKESGPAHSLFKDEGQ